jgi:hypothetical protein
MHLRALLAITAVRPCRRVSEQKTKLGKSTYLVNVRCEERLAGGRFPA